MRTAFLWSLCELIGGAIQGEMQSNHYLFQIITTTLYNDVIY